MTENPAIERRSYGPVDLVIEPDRHIYVTSLGAFKVVFAILGVGIEGLMAWALWDLGHDLVGPRPDVAGSLPFVCVFGLGALAILVLTYSAVAWQVRLEFSPTGIVFSRHGLSLIGGRAGRSGTWRWRLEDLVGINLSMSPYRDRGGEWMRSGIYLKIVGEDRPVKTFFTFHSLEDVEEFRQQLLASVVEMAKRRGTGPLPEARFVD